MGEKSLEWSVMWGSEEKGQESERDYRLWDKRHERKAQSQECNKEACFYTGQNLGMGDTDWK